ncbi:uncharacterized protein LOC128218008 [Mya arenaria]|uniref:uncharacterized protein LOC128218008 n=1 Tax=Mya arenaria TaxID=6604 RepID=UPI0022DEEADC|nr:uncharacterized protein LOC128218008 [Mya arenaria]
MISLHCVNVCVLVVLTSCMCARGRSTGMDDDSSGFWWAPKGVFHHHQHHHSEPKPEPWCQCYDFECFCCAEKLITRDNRGHIHMNACVNMRWLPEEDVFSVVFTVNGNDVYRTNTALSSRKVEECIPTSGLLVHPTGKICFRLYQIEVDSGQMCADLIGKAIIQGKEEVIKEHFGCFRIGDVV